MALLNPLLPNKHQSACLSPFTPRYPRKTPHRFYVPSSEYRTPPSPPYLLPFATRRFLVSARRFGVPSSRRNYLRKKLVGDQQVRSEKQTSLDPTGSGFGNPGQEFDDIYDSQENLRGPDADEESEAGFFRNDVDVALSGKRKAGIFSSESAPFRKLESWVDQYNNDAAYWGIGSNPIFIVFEDMDGNAKRVVVDEVEILRRSSDGERDLEAPASVSSKILYAKGLASDMENGKNVIPRNSSVVKFVDFKEEPRVVSAVLSVVNRPDFIPVMSGVGKLLFCGVVCIWAVKKLLIFGGEKKFTKLEKEMMRRKIKSRKEKESLERGSVEVVQEQLEPSVTFESPKIDKDDLMKCILEAEGLTSNLALKDPCSSVVSQTKDLDGEIVDVRATARQSTQIESRRHSVDSNDGVKNIIINEKSSSDMQEMNEHVRDIAETAEVPSGCQNFSSLHRPDTNETKNKPTPDAPKIHENLASKGFSYVVSETKDLEREIVGMRAITGQARQIENKGLSPGSNNGVENHTFNEESSSKIQEMKEHAQVISGNAGVPNDCQNFDSVQRPDTHEIKKKISPDTPTGCGNSVLKDPSISVFSETKDLDGEVGEIVTIAGLARHVGSEGQSLGSDSGIGNHLRNEKSSSEIQEGKGHARDVAETDGVPNGYRRSDSIQRLDMHEIKDKTSPDIPTIGTGFIDGDQVPLEEHMALRASKGMPSGDALEDIQTMLEGEVIQPSDIPMGSAYMLNSGPVKKKATVIRSVKEAREFLARTTQKNSRAPRLNGATKRKPKLRLPANKMPDIEKGQGVEMKSDLQEPPTLNGASESLLVPSTCEDSDLKNVQYVIGRNDGYIDSEIGQEVHDAQNCDVPFATEKGSKNSENWMEKNFHEVEPLVKKIGDGFRENYMVARGKANELESSNSSVRDFNFNADDSELGWMRDDSLREIVFQVRENELAGRDPFHLMDADSKLKFFEGLKRKVEQENEKLQKVHEYLHANIENLDYGADGISVYDPPEKIIPRWKGTPPEFLNSFPEQRNSVFSRKARTSLTVNEDGHSVIQISTKSQLNEEIIASHSDSNWNKSSPVKDPKDHKTVIEGSDGSVRTGKKSGKEYWQHTKKWTREFLEVYNAETDPDVKATMRDIGKGLDRWITEKEVQEAAEFREKVRERSKPFMEKKISKLKRELELFGPQAVVSKYREYAEEEEEDYLWWLDLPHVLCIELYTIENGKQKIGMYSLEMAADLELEPKPCHVIAFEDAGDCKKLCYIIQAHMEMLGNGNAFVVARPPKDAFREAKANGFSVTVLKKGELELNIDQPLEEVEEQITEIGSKMYHDKLIRGRSVDINALMKGVLGSSEPTARTGRKSERKMLKRKLKKPSKP